MTGGIVADQCRGVKSPKRRAAALETCSGDSESREGCGAGTRYTTCCRDWRIVSNAMDRSRAMVAPRTGSESRIAGQEGQAPWAASDARSSLRKKRRRSRGTLGVRCWFDHTTISRLNGRRGCAVRSAGLSITRVRSRAVSRRPPCRIVGRPCRKRLWSYTPPRGHRVGKPWRRLTRTRGWLAPRATNFSSPIPGFTEPPRRKPGRFSFSSAIISLPPAA